MTFLNKNGNLLIRIAMIENNMTYNKLAKKMNLKHTSNIINQINGKRTIGLKRIRKICEILNIDFKEIIYNTYKKTSIN